MNAPIIWIGLPGITAVFLWFFQKNERRILFIGIGASLFFILTASLLSIGKPLVRLGGMVLQISPSISLLGRSFTLGNGDLVYVSLIFIILFLFISMSFVIDIPVRFVPIGFMLTSLSLAALSVQPFLYAALLLEICVILSVILLSSYGVIPTNGVMRFLIFQTLAMPFMLASGWVLSAVEANPTETKLIFQALILLGLGFSFWLGVFPFNSWMAQIAEEKPPFLVGFILLLFNTATLILVIRYLDGFVWLRDDARIFSVLRFMGILMMVSSAIMFLLEKKAARTIAYLVSFETGLSIISLSLNQTAGWNAFVLMFLPRILAISLWAALLSYIQQFMAQQSDSEIQNMHPIILIGFGLAAFSIAGMPILPGFVSRVSIYSHLANTDFPGLIWVCIGNLLFILAFIRFLINIYNDYPFGQNSITSKLEKGYFFFFCAVILVNGIVPQFFLRSIMAMLQAFPNIK